MASVLVIRIAGQVKNKIKDNETLKRLKLEKKFTSRIIDEDDTVRMGMIKSVLTSVCYGVVSSDLIKKMEPRKKGDVYFLHPPRGGFKKSSKVAAPKGILGKNDDIAKLAERML